MPNAQILNLGHAPVQSPEQRSNTGSDEFIQSRDLIDETRSDVQRMQIRFKRQQELHESHDRRINALAVIVIAMVLVLAGAIWISYPTITNPGLRDALNLGSITGALSDRINSLEAGVKTVTGDFPALRTDFDQFKTTVATSLQSARTQAQAAATRIGGEIREEVNQAIHLIESRVATLESNQQEASQHAAQLQEQISKLQLELAAMRSQAGATDQRIGELDAVQQASGAALLGVSERTAANERTLSAVSNHIDRGRIEFEVQNKRPTQIASDLYFTPNRMNVDRQEVDGTLQFGTNGRKLVFTKQAVQTPIIFYMPNEERPSELILTEVAKNSVKGYVMSPLQSNATR